MVGKTLSHYRIQEELGRGGMGIVYRAEDTKPDRVVAVKILPASALPSEDDRARFYREAKSAGSLEFNRESLEPHIRCGSGPRDVPNSVEVRFTINLPALVA